MEDTAATTFEVFDVDTGAKVATNGTIRLILVEGAAGKVFRRRAVRGFNFKPAAEQVLPRLNEFAGELVANPKMPAEEVVNRLRALAGLIKEQHPERIEWAVAELDGVRVYVAGGDVVVTRLDLNP